MKLKFCVAAACAIAAAPTLAGNWNVPTNAKGLRNPVERNVQTQAAGKAIFASQCVACHGENAAGDGTQARVEYDLRDIIAELTDGELFWKITHGVGRMPSYGGALSDKERWLMVNHLRVLADERTAQAGKK